MIPQQDEEYWKEEITLENNEKKMKSGVFVHPTTAKGKIIAVLFLALILLGTVPGIYLFNHPILIAGIPLMLWFGMVYIVLVTVVLCLANHWKVY